MNNLLLGIAVGLLSAIPAWHLGKVRGMKQMLLGPRPALRPNPDWNKSAEAAK